jgi:hypothetical protein
MSGLMTKISSNALCLSLLLGAVGCKASNAKDASSVSILSTTTLPALGGQQPPFVSGGYVYIGADSSLDIVKVNGGTDAAYVGRVPVGPQPGGQVLIFGITDTAIFAELNGQAFAIDITDKEHPVAGAAPNTGVGIGSITAIRGKYAFMCSAVYDITNPNAWQEVASASTGMTFNSCVADDRYVFGMTNTFRLQMFDMMNPLMPVALPMTDFDLSGGTPGQGPYAIFAAGGGVLYTEAGKGKSVVDASNPAHPGFVGGSVSPFVVDETHGRPLSFVASSARRGDTFVSVEANAGLMSGKGAPVQLTDVSDPKNPSTSTLYLPSLLGFGPDAAFTGVAIDDTYIYVNSEHGLVILK